jgi:hypothetical protein
MECTFATRSYAPNIAVIRPVAKRDCTYIAEKRKFAAFTYDENWKMRCKPRALMVNSDSLASNLTARSVARECSNPPFETKSRFQ